MEAKDGPVKDERLALPCPHPDCGGSLKFAPDLPGGEYACICKQITVRLAWDTHVNYERKPRIEMVEKK